MTARGPNSEQTEEGEREGGSGKPTNKNDSNIEHQGVFLLFPYILVENTGVTKGRKEDN